tara:strand:- start:439 stop:681 length:243 start_codon:yes stop_codon:yes gene_type:complete
MNYQEALYHIDRLSDWGDNEQAPTSYDKFLGLIGEINWPASAKPLGFLEADLLGKALQAYSCRPDAFKEHLSRFYQDDDN